jgi:hypothetical protein
MIVSYDTNMPDALTPIEYRAFQQAYDFFNAELFSNSLPPVLLTLQRKPKARGYFAPEKFQGRIEETAAHELALNPDHFTGRTDQEILSTLVHEMVHVWQETHGRPPRRCYHDRQWAGKMKEVGLQPTDTGAPGGKETGQSVTHYIMPAGPFQEAFTRLEATGYRLHWQSRLEQTEQAKSKRASKTKFVCPTCEQNAWAKPDAQLICGECYEADGEITAMLPEA